MFLILVSSNFPHIFNSRMHNLKSVNNLISDPVISECHPDMVDGVVELLSFFVAFGVISRLQIVNFANQPVASIPLLVSVALIELHCSQFFIDVV